MCSFPGCVAQSRARIPSLIPSSILCLATTFVSPSADSRGAFVTYLRQYVHLGLLLSLPRIIVVRFTNRPDMMTHVNFLIFFTLHGGIISIKYALPCLGS